MWPRFNPAEAKSHPPSDYRLRFAFGAGISLVAGVIGMRFGPTIGGVLLGFPAILPASLTLIEKKEGGREASIDSVGAVMGATAMIAFAVLVSLSVRAWGVVPSLIAALVVWAAVAVTLCAIVAVVFQREAAPP